MALRAEFSLAHLTVIGLSPPAMIEAAARAGYDDVSLRLIPVTEQEPPYRLDRDPSLMRETKARLADTGLKVLDIELCRLFPDVLVSDFKSALEAGAELGARHVIAGAVDGDIGRLAKHFAQLCELAAPLGLTVNLEPVTFFPIPDIGRASQVLAEADRPNGGLLVDTLHFFRSHGRLDALEALPRRWLHFAQLSDAPTEAPPTSEGLIYAARSARLYLGEGGLDVNSVVKPMPAMPYVLENPNDAAVAAYGWEEHARRTLAAARSYLNA